MERLDKLEKCLFVNNYSQYLLNFLAAGVNIGGLCNSEKWKLIFEKIEDWKKQYLISSNTIELYGINGWYVDLEFSRFHCPDSMKSNIEDYVAIILLINLILYCDDDALEFECLINSDFEQYFHTHFDYPVEECTRLSKTQFCDELQHIYHCSHDRFEYYANVSKSNNPKVIEAMQIQYPVYLDQLEFFRHGLAEDCRILRMNSLGSDEDMWYLIIDDSDVFLISVVEII